MEDDDGVDESHCDSFAHQKSPISGDAVSPPYCAPCPLARTAVPSENRRFSGSRESPILERLLEGGGLAPAFSQLSEIPRFLFVLFLNGDSSMGFLWSSSRCGVSIYSSYARVMTHCEKRSLCGSTSSSPTNGESISPAINSEKSRSLAVGVR